MSPGTIAIAIAAFALSTAAQAQWTTERTPNIPRLADGKPNLAAPAPRTAEGKPDFSGIWIAVPDPAYLMNIASDLQPSDVQPWAEKQATERMNAYGKDDPAAIGCQPFGPRHIFGTMLNEAARTKIVQTRALVIVLHEDLAYRQIFLDGRKLPKVSNPAFMGFSVGRWDGEELVVESEGFNEASWLDFGGHPHSDALRITERYRRVDFGHIQRRQRPCADGPDQRHDVLAAYPRDLRICQRRQRSGHPRHGAQHRSELQNRAAARFATLRGINPCSQSYCR